MNLADLGSGWSLPFELKRVKSNEAEFEVGAAQMTAICESADFLERREYQRGGEQLRRGEVYLESE